MKEKIVFPFLFLLLLFVPLVSASFFDWITGRTTEETQTSIITEQVKCAFINSNSEQKCFTADGKFACSGTGTCVV